MEFDWETGGDNYFSFFGRIWKVLGLALREPYLISIMQSHLIDAVYQTQLGWLCIII